MLGRNYREIYNYVGDIDFMERGDFAGDEGSLSWGRGDLQRENIEGNILASICE